MHGAIIQIKGAHPHLVMDGRQNRGAPPDLKSPKAGNVPFLLLILFGLPIVEIATFVVVGSKIGVLATIGLVILASVAGSILLRIQGFGAMQRIRTELAAGRDPGRELAHGFMIVVAGVLLLIPGFVTDVIGLLLFVPAVRDLAWRFIKGRITVASVGAGFGSFRGSRHRGPTIDLDAEDFSSSPDPKSPWRIGDRR
jgi:UPF0716 protein FxsA